MFESIGLENLWVAVMANVIVIVSNYAILTHRVRAMERKMDNGLFPDVRRLGERLAHIEGMLSRCGSREARALDMKAGE